MEAIKLKNIASTLCYEKSVLKYQKGNLWGLVTLNGKEITKPTYDSIDNLQSTEGKMIVSKNGKFGVINIKGTLLVDTKYDNIVTDNYYNNETKYVEAGFIVSNTTNDGYRYGYANYKGEEILSVEYNNINRVTAQKDLYLIASKNGQYGLYKSQKEIIKPEYQSISYTDNGAIIIERNAQFGIANLKGNIKVEPKYTNIEEEGMYLYAQTAGSNDVYDVDANKLDVSFNKSVYETENDKYRINTIVNNDVTYYGIESKDGDQLVESKYSYLEYIFGDYFIAENQDGKYGVINANGKIQIKFNYDLIQKIKNKNVIQLQKSDSKNIEIYSSALERVIKMKNAKIQNKNNYINVSNKEETIYLDKEGNKIEESSEMVQRELKTELPQKIGEYEKKQYSLDDVYYEK